MTKFAEYIWMDGAKPTQKLRSKARVINHLGSNQVTPDDFPEWGFDGSSTYQTEGSSSDLTLKPVCVVDDPLSQDGNYLVLCEVLYPNGTPHESNTRAKLRSVLDRGAKEVDPWFGIEQEYTLFKGRTPLGWPDSGYPAPQGPFYCGVGSDEVFGRSLVTRHAKACMDAGLMLFGINAEVMPGQWEFQIGYRGLDNEHASPLNVADHVWIARWLLYRLGEDYGISATLANKPVQGDWNGAGQHTNFSTSATRDKASGMEAINRIIARLEKKHKDHISVYGDKLSERLTGLHETCPIDQFKSGVGHRGASIRIPSAVAEKGYGYLEDRRPGANADPYSVATRILSTICDLQ